MEKCLIIIASCSALGQSERIDDVLSGLVLEPALRCPPDVLISWVKLLVYEQRYEAAEDLLKEYVSCSSHLDEEDSSANVNEPS